MCLFVLVAARGQVSQRSDALILIQPAGDATLVVITYADQRAHAEARQRALQIASLAGAEVLALTVRDVEVGLPDEGDRRPALKNGSRRGAQTGVELTLQGSPFVRGQAMWLQPLLGAMRGTRRFETLFMVPAIPNFAGLRSYEAPGLTIRLVQAGNPYHYMVTEADGTRDLPEVPLYQPVTPDDRRPRTNRSMRPHPMVFVLAVGAGVGVIVFLIMVRRGSVRQGPHQSP